MSIGPKPKILYLDDEQENLDGFYYTFFEFYDIHITTNHHEAIRILAETPIEVFLVDQKMPHVSGIDFIKSLKPQFPDLICILITAYANLNDAIDAVNEVNIFRLLSKPWNKAVILKTIAEAVENYRLRESNKNLLLELKQRNIELEEAYKKVQISDKLKSVFLKNLSHEIRTPLNGIMGFSELLLYRFNNDTIEKTYADFIYSSGEKLLTVIDDIIIASLIQANAIQQNFSAFYPQDLLYELNEKFRRRIEESQLDVSFQVQPNAIKKIISDKDKIFKILQNLIDNALKFTSQGHIKVTCDILPESAKKSQLLLVVTDTGQGIDHFNLSKIFEPFAQIIENNMTLASGTGLGLTICKAYIELLQGNFAVESQLNKGTRFQIKLPILTDPATISE